MFPIIPHCQYLEINTSTDTSLVDTLINTWMDVLNTTVVPDNDSNFLEQGGTSFAAVFLVSKLRRLHSVNISIIDLLKNPNFGVFMNIVLSADKIAETKCEPRTNSRKEGNISNAQQRMIVMQESAPLSTSYVETAVVVTSTDRPVDARETFQALLQVHPILTSKIKAAQNQQSFFMTPDHEMKVDVTEEQVSCDDIVKYISDTIPLIQVLSSPLAIFRKIIYRNQTFMVVHVHHIICDEVTLSSIKETVVNILQRSFLDQVKDGDAYQLYLQSEHDYRKSNQFAEDGYFWQKLYLTIPPTSTLSNLPEGQSLFNDSRVYQAKHHFADLPNEVLGLIKELKLTEFQYYLACSVIVIQRYLGTEEIALAVPVTTRSFQFKKSDGLFVNTIIPKFTSDGNVCLVENIKHIAETWLQAMDHSHYPLDELSRYLWQQHNQSFSSFCNVMFNYVCAASDSSLNIPAKHAKMPLTINFVQGQSTNKTQVWMEWATELVPDNTAKRLSASIVELIAQSRNELETPLYKAPTLSKSETRLIQSFSESRIPQDYDEVPCHITFEKHVQLYGNEIAIICDGRSLTYQELNSKGNKIAAGILNIVHPQELKKKPVVLLMKKGEEAIASILGIWKAGGHFLPVSISNRSTIKNIYQRADPALVITTEDIGSLVKDFGKSTCPVLSVDDVSGESDHKYIIEQSIEDIAYVIRTSGSTGTPKQCKVSHRSLQIMSTAWKEIYKMDKFKVNILQWAPLSFDVFVGDLTRALVSVPGTMVICSDERRLDIPCILNLIKVNNISLVEVTPQFGQQIVENADIGDLDSLQILILGSDAVKSHLFTRVKNQLKPNQRLINSYGMTEATIDSACFEGDPPVTRSGTVPIGKPLPGVKLQILNPKTLQPCPIGTVGELYIGGDILASGDVEVVSVDGLNTNNLKTGDSACWLPSGDIELLGRLDNVMKLRGFRISSTEIENKIISKNPEIKSVCVTPVTSENDVEFLCAFVVLNGVNDGDISKKTLGDRMKGDLPYYMIPDVVHIIKKIPLTTNGKVNIKALPTLPNLFRASEKHTQAYESKPSSLSTLKGLFTEAMCLANIDDVDTEQTFMEQGGHSLTLLRFSTLIKQRTDYTISIADIFSYPSLSTLSRFIDENQKTEDISESPKTTDTAGEHIDIAITGVGMRLPGDISSISELWKVLTHGEDLIREFPASRKDDALKCMNSTTSEALSACDTFQGSFLDSIDHFDSQFFKIPPGEAKYMSPEQRLFLQVATEALSEGRNIDKIKGSKVGVFVSNSEISYAELDLPDEAISISGLMPGMIATRVAYQFDLKGPTLLVDTACSSSLMALKLACESIQKGECDGALVGGANLVLYPARTGVFGETGILSPDFHCKAFDRDATGTAVGEGVMCIYVEPLKAATQKGKPIYGVLKGVASNSVGHGNGITAPTSASQKQVIESALKLSQMAPSDISFIEAHGTGTKLGDKIELSALSSVFSPKAGVRDIPIGAAKSIFGHLDSAAGMIGILKVLASMMFKKIPPTAHFKNPHSELVDSLLAVPAKTTVWPSNVNRSRAAGISSFGLTGTNCHAIISQSQPLGQINDNNITSPLLLTGNDHNQIQNQIRRHITFIEETVVNAGINTISSLCVAVANRIRDLGQAKLGYMTLKLAIYLKSHTQALKVLELLNSCNDMDDMANLADVRSDIGVNFLKQRREANQGVEDFLTSGTVNLDLLFGDDKPVPARGVYLEMFNPKRHWCDPSSSSPTEKVGLLNILETKLSDAREMVRSLPLAASEELRELEGKFCVAIVIKLLMTTKLNQYLKQSSEVSLKTIFKETGMLPKYDKLFYVMIRELYDNHVVIPTGNDKSIHCLDTFRFYCEHLLDANPEPIAQYAMEKYPAWSDCFRFPLYCSQYLTKVLWGNMSPLSVIYPQGDLNYMYQFDKLGDLIGDVYYNMYMQLIAAYAKQLSGRGRKVRILEVGAGMGHVTRQLIPKLKDMPNIEYWFTDLGKAFVENAKTLFEDYLHMMKFSTFDITKSAPKQGLLGCYDIVISYNVIHTTESVMDSVINLKSCLGEDGTLFIIESAKNETWATLAWGILDGWWYFKDYDLRPDEPMMEPEKWERVLKGSGFGSVHSCPVDQFERDQVEKFLFVCSAKPLVGELQQLPGWWETIDLKTRRHQDLEDEVCKSTDTGVEDAPVERTAVHGELKQIWCELFGIDNIKPGDEFNSLGGESLLAIQMMTMVRKRIGYQLEIADTFGYPSLGGLADFIADKLEDGVEIEMGDTEQWSNISTPSSLSEIDENECVSTMLMFPGQGSQKPGMCVSMKDSPEARAVFNEAAKILGYNILEMFLQNDKNLAEKLKSTEFVQVALLVGCLAKTEQIKAENPEKLNNITYVSGLSVGEFAALVYSKVISFEEALKIVQVRGHAMENEVHRSATGMVSVFGPSTDKLQKFLNEKFSHVKISTYLADNQHTVAGTESETEELVRVLSGELKDDMDIIDVRKLRVAGAFHSTYMKPASEIVDPIIESVEFSKPTVPLIMNVTGEVVNDPVEIKSFVCEQLVAPVLWKQSVITAYEAGVTNFVEVAPARVISSIVKNRIASVKNCTVDLIVV
ncbi:polyketide synthase PksJ [Patella vulgata]|uniref:polyketide synthase PksJ n=1 Tax=Patella vulgata TaxID=6465 RepID=UPI0024A94BBC|nr:polyketide synthase PksJ [Patella vulgata]